MLVLSRKRDESIVIGDNIEITVVDVKGDQVKIGVKAPRAVSVHRKEVYEAIQRENVAAAKPHTPSMVSLANLAKNLRKPEPPAAPPAPQANPASEK